MGPAERTLRDGLMRIIKHGHCKREYGDYSRGYCAVGALGLACDLLPEAGLEGIDAAGDIIKRLVGRHVHQWNDHPMTSQDEVIAVFRQAIEVAVKESR